MAALALAISAFVGSCNAAGGQENDPRRAFLKDYEPHAVKLQDYYGNAFVIYQYKYEMGNGDSQVMEIEGKIKGNRYVLKETRNRVVTKTGETKKELGLGLEGRNPYYYFRLGNTPEKGWRIIDLKFPVADKLIPECHLGFPIASTTRSQDYLNLARDQTVRIIAYRDAVWETRGTKELSIEFEAPDPVEKKTITLRGKCYFSPADGWVCCGEEFGAIRTVYFYNPRVNTELPLPLRAEERLDGKLIFTTFITEFRNVAPYNEVEFRLSAFGLPEPPGMPVVDVGGSRWYLWFIGAAVASLGTGWYFWRRIQRRKLAAVSESTSK